MIQRAPDPNSRKRVWWCPTGALSSIPVHAAGVYNGSSQDRIGKYVISSYTPTISALYRLLDQTPTQPSPIVNSEILLVAQPSSVHGPPLVNVRTEMDTIRSFVPSDYTTYLNDGRGTSVSDALESLKTAQVVHLACHGH